jgi:hypothetical protein
MYTANYFDGKFIGIKYVNENGEIVSCLKGNNPEYKKFEKWHSEHPDFSIADIPTSEEDELNKNRKIEYYNQSCTPDELIVALWEYVVENRPAAMNELQAKRLAVKQKYPKS